MRKTFSALRWKEVNEVGKSMIVVPFFAGALFGRWVPDPAEPGYSVGNTTIALLLLSVYALITGYNQTSRESSRDMWAFARHRPATDRQIFGAKLFAGGGALLFSMLAAGVPVMWVLLLLRHLPIDTTHFLAAIAESTSVLGWYAAGLNQGAPGGSGARAYVGHIAALGGSLAVQWKLDTNPATGMLVSIVLTMLITAMAWFAFINGAESEAEGKAAGGVA